MWRGFLSARCRAAAAAWSRRTRTTARRRPAGIPQPAAHAAGCRGNGRHGDGVVRPGDGTVEGGWGGWSRGEGRPGSAGPRGVDIGLIIRVEHSSLTVTARDPHCESETKQDTKLLPATSPNLSRLTEISKFLSPPESAVNLQQILLTYPATPWACRYTTLWNMNVRKLATLWKMHRDWGSITKHFSCDMLLCYQFITQFAGERIFKMNI